MNKSKRILIVDDVKLNRELLQSYLESMNYESEEAQDGIEALAKLDLNIDLVLLDVMMPVMDGYEVVRQIRDDPNYSDIPVIMVTALTDKEDRLRAVESGANDFITKPIERNELRLRVTSLLKMKEGQDLIKQHRAELEDKVKEQTASLRKALEKMAEAQRKTYKAHLSTIYRLAVAAEYKDQHTAAHIRRMSHYSAIIAKGLNLPPGEVEIILNSSPMHDVGKLGIPDAIMLKPGKLNEEEREIIKQHTIIGSRILCDSESELLNAGETIALTHHEKWDGSGYPQGLAGEEIPLWGRICAVADVFDALTTKRPYKEAIDNVQVYEILKNEKGSHFDPNVIEVFFDRLPEIISIQAKYRDD
ncbi:MAG: response regulator [Deltaproteobacteria bacterium]|nr:response regulator [Deltaproteobacteria bacterium]